MQMVSPVLNKGSQALLDSIHKTKDGFPCVTSAFLSWELSFGAGNP